MALKLQVRYEWYHLQDDGTLDSLKAVSAIPCHNGTMNQSFPDEEQALAGLEEFMAAYQVRNLNDLVLMKVFDVERTR